MFTTTASWFETLGTATGVTTRCVTESDGYHAHEYRLGDPFWSRLLVTEHLHAWMDEHLATFPHVRAVSVENGHGLVAYLDTPADAAPHLGIPAADLPAVTCNA